MLPIALALPLMLAAAPAPTVDDEAEVRKALEQYRSALLKKDGAAAADAVDADTLGYYTKMIDLALNADATSSKQQTMLDRLMVLRLRHEVGAERLKKMSGRELFIYAVDKGWVSASSVAKAEMGAVKITRTQATGEFMSGGKAAPFGFLFNKGSNGWRFSLMPLLAIGEPAFKHMAKQAGQEENEFLFALLAKVSGKPVPATIWEPLVVRPKTPSAKP